LTLYNIWKIKKCTGTERQIEMGGVLSLGIGNKMHIGIEEYDVCPLR
jgi:hypothetical protein